MKRAMFLAASLLTACGATPISTGVVDTGSPTDATAAGDVPSAALTVEQLFPALTEAACASLLRCPGSSDSATARVLFGDVPSCVAAVQRLGGGDVADLQRGVREGRVRYDGAAAGRCLAAIRARCDVSLAVDDLCADVFQGTIPANGQCFRHEECADGGYCQSASSTCPGVCAPRRAAGQPCTSDRQCASAGAQPGRCHTDDGAMNARCVALGDTTAAEGQPCGVVVTRGAVMGARAACATGLYCRKTNGAAEGTCQRPLTAGSPCRPGDACVDGSVCSGSMCRSYTLLGVAGQACDQAALRVCSPVANLSCVSGACVSNGTAAAGSACAPGDIVEVFSCNAGLYCDRMTRRCVARQAAGAACDTDRGCASGACAAGRCLDRMCNTAL